MRRRATPAGVSVRPRDRHAKVVERPRGKVQPPGDRWEIGPIRHRCQESTRAGRPRSTSGIRRRPSVGPPPRTPRENGQTARISGGPRASCPHRVHHDARRCGRDARGPFPGSTADLQSDLRRGPMTPVRARTSRRRPPARHGCGAVDDLRLQCLPFGASALHGSSSTATRRPRNRPTLGMIHFSRSPARITAAGSEGGGAVMSRSSDA